MATSIGKMTHASRVVSTNSPFYGIQRGSLGTPVSPSGLRPIGTPREDVYGAHAVEISVGGTVFTASRATWTRFTGTLLAAIVDSKWSSQVLRDKDGRFFIERSPRLFSHILTFLQQPNEPIEGIHAEDEGAFKRELMYYGLDTLVYSKGDLVGPHFWQELSLDDQKPFDVYCEYVVLAFDNAVVNKNARTWRTWVPSQPKFAKHVFDLHKTCLDEIEVWSQELGPDGKRKRDDIECAPITIRPAVVRADAMSFFSYGSPSVLADGAASPSSNSRDVRAASPSGTSREKQSGDHQTVTHMIDRTLKSWIETPQSSILVAQILFRPLQ